MLIWLPIICLNKRQNQRNYVKQSLCTVVAEKKTRFTYAYRKSHRPGWSPVWGAPAIYPAPSAPCAAAPTKPRCGSKWPPLWAADPWDIYRAPYTCDITERRRGNSLEELLTLSCYARKHRCSIKNTLRAERPSSPSEIKNIPCEIARARALDGKFIFPNNNVCARVYIYVISQ